MCGIFGSIHRDVSILSHYAANKLLAHRGPDDDGWLLYNGVNLLSGKSVVPKIPARLLFCHTRLAILDLQEAIQPMIYDQRFALVFNGEIYNYLELREQLQNYGRIFQTKSDTEVLLQSYIYWGKSCLNKLVGMFSFAIFDKATNKIFMARDGFGIKPLYYTLDGNIFLFASEIKALLPFVTKRNLNSHTLFQYMRSGLTDFGDNTLFAKIKQLLPGHHVEFDLNSHCLAAPMPYWQPSINTNNDLSFTQAACTLQTQFLDNMALHLRSDVTVAATLSGGIDSSAIVSCMRHLNPNLPIHTFSYIAPESQFNEERWIDIVNQQINATAHKVSTDAAELLTDIEKIIAHQDEPFGSTSIYAQHRVFEAAARSGIKVMLDGQGADEMLGGYHFYLAARLATLLKSYRFYDAWLFLRKIRSGYGARALFPCIYYLLPFTWQKGFRKLGKFDYVPNWLNVPWFKQRDVEFLPIKRNYGKQVLHETLAHTLANTSLPMLLRYVDRNSMAHSIESRLPFLTTQLADFIFSLPEDYIVSSNAQTKSVFRAAMQGIVPQAILNRTDKIGFATPERNWLLQLKPWLDQAFKSDYARNMPIFKHDFLLKQWQQVQTGQGVFDNRYWRWINLIKWSEVNQVDFN